MSILFFNLIATTLLSSFLIICVWIGVRLLPKLSHDDQAFAWWAVSWFTLIHFVGGCLSSVFGGSGNINLYPFSKIHDLIGIRFFSNELYVKKGDVWVPDGAFSPHLTILFVIWAICASGLLLIRGYQLFLSVQFVVWSRAVADEGVSEHLNELRSSLNIAPNVSARESAILRSPAVVGFFRNTLLLPNNLSTRISTPQLRAILAHELAHVKARDTVTVLAMLGCEALMWFNPLAWLMHREWGAAREFSADKQAIQATAISPTDFSKLLLSLVGESKQPFLQTSISATRDFKTLKRRLLEMNLTRNRVHDSRPFRWVFALGLSAVLFTPFRSALASPQIEDTNIVKDGGFEQGLKNWIRRDLGGASDEVEFSIDTTIKHSGKSSLKMTKSVNRFWPVQMVGQEEVGARDVTKRLKVSVWIKAENAKKATLAVFFNGDSESQKIEFAPYVGNDKGGVVTHDWKHYSSVLEVPEGTSNIHVFAQMYGPGSVWFDDMDLQYVPSQTPLSSGTKTEETGDPEIDAIKVQDRMAGGDKNKRYFYIRGGLTQPKDGFKVAVILPGGDGSADFNPFIKRTFFNCGETKEFVYAQLVAPKWTNPQGIVWPIQKSSVKEAKFTTEEFVSQVIKEVSKSVKVDPKYVYVYGWSSGGPACYASLIKLPEVTGAFIAMSIFRPDDYGPLVLAKGKKVYLYQSPDDNVTKLSWAKTAFDRLSAAGAKVQLTEYPGGHGFTSGSIFEDISKGFEWLVKQ